jgi:hypothetical protein
MDGGVVADTRIRRVVGTATRTCAICGVRDEQNILESRDRRRGRALITHRDLHKRWYTVCRWCATRSSVDPDDGIVLDLRDGAH